MKRTTQPRATVNLSKSVQHQVNMYALAASATGVALLAGAQLEMPRSFTHPHTSSSSITNLSTSTSTTTE